MHRIAVAIAFILTILLALPASAQVVITQAKALAGNVTPGDTPGYPITLSEPGAYILGSNLTVPSGNYGIYAGVDNINVDLNDFVISGGRVATYAFVSSKEQGRIHGGVIKWFKGSGIYLRGDAWTIEDMKIVQNLQNGVDALGARLVTVQNSLIAVNGLRGIAAGDIGYFRNNKVVNNGFTGILCGFSCHAEGNLIDLNQDYGISFASGMVIGNTITRSIREGVADNNGDPDTGYSNNMFVANGKVLNRTTQIVGGVVVHPNYCAGGIPCTAP